MMAEESDFSLQKGIFLAAHPFIGDELFERSVVLLTHYDKEDGAMGFILNKPSDVVFHEAAPDLPFLETEVGIGGPITQNRLHFLHRAELGLKDSNHVFEDVYWGRDFEGLVTAITRKEISEENVRFFAGYAGWEAGQLEDEIAEGSWLVIKGSDDIAYAQDGNNIWSQLMMQLDESFKIFAHMPEHPSLN